MVAVEQGEEAGLGAGRALHSSEPEIIACTFDVTQIPQELLQTRLYTPKSRAYNGERT